MRSRSLRPPHLPTSRNEFLFDGRSFQTATTGDHGHDSHTIIRVPGLIEGIGSLAVSSGYLAQTSQHAAAAMRGPRLRVVTYDTTGLYKLDDHAALASAMVQHAVKNGSGPVTIEGHSRGGIVARRAAAELGPDYVERVIGTSSAGLIQPYEFDERHALRQAIEVIAHSGQQLLAVPNRHEAQATVKVMSHIMAEGYKHFGDAPRAAVDEIREIFAANTNVIGNELVETLGSGEVHEMLAGRDAYFPAQHVVKRLAEVGFNGGVHSQDDANHLTQLVSQDAARAEYGLIAEEFSPYIPSEYSA